MITNKPQPPTVHPSVKATIRRYAERGWHPQNIAALTGVPIDVVRRVLSVKTLRAERHAREAKRLANIERKRERRQELLAAQPSRQRDRQIRMLDTLGTLDSMSPAVDRAENVGCARLAERFYRGDGA